MSDQFLRTKLFIPPVRKGLVHRPRLMNRLIQGMEGKLTLIAGPAGFGKSTLLSEWLPQAKRPVGWISLDDGDNDWNRFVLYLIKAFQNISDGFASEVVEMLFSDKPHNRDVLVPYLINRMAEIHTPFLIVLDDYHAIIESEIHDLMQEILENIPPKMHLIISTRSDPPFPLARWRARGELSEIRIRDLRFNLEESEIFLNKVMGLGLPRSAVSQLNARIEGWPAGLQMAVLSLRNRENVTDFIQTFTGSQRYVFDYLLDEVFQGLSPNIQEFLLKTSVLDRMCADLCDHLRGADDSQNILDQLDRMNLFLVPLDDHRSWYRFHHLFTDLIRQIAYRKCADDILILHGKARQWYQANGLIRETIHHGVAENNFELVADLIEKNFLAVLEHRDWIALRQWLDALPPASIQSRPWLGVAHAYVLLSSGSNQEIPQMLQQVENSISQMVEPEGSRIRSNIAYIRAELAVRSGDITATIDYARKSLVLIHEGDKRLRCSVASILGTALQRSGAFDEAAHVFTDGIVAGRTIGDSNAVISLYGDLVGLFVEQSRLIQAYAYCQEALQFIESIYQKRGRYTPGAAHIHFRLSTILRHWNDLDGSLQHARLSDEILKKWGLHYRIIYVNLAIAYHTVGNYSEAHRVLNVAQQIAQQQSAYWLENVEATRVSFWLAEGNLEAASQWALKQNLASQVEVDYEKQLIFRTLAQVRIAQARAGNAKALEQSVQLLSELEKMYSVSGVTAYLLRTFILQALAFQVKGDLDHALNSITKAIALGEGGGYIYIFVREGESIRDLLHKVVAAGQESPYIDDLLGAFDQQKNQKKSDPDMTETMTERELDVLSCLDSGMTVPEIADSLVISVGTVRTHIKHIYRKLDVHSRFEAVVKARELKLIKHGAP